MPKKQAKAVGNQEITKRLDAIIALLAQPGERRVGKSIGVLRSAGLRPTEIGRILGKPLSYVTATLAMAKRRNVKKRRGGIRQRKTQKLRRS